VAGSCTGGIKASVV